MPRRMTIRTVEMGAIDLWVIRQEGETWESEWDLLRPQPFAKLLPVVTREALDSAIYGWSKLLVRSIGLPPEGALRKIPGGLMCALRKECPLHDRKTCLSSAKKMPTCFEPLGVEEEARTLAAQVCRAWFEGTYVIIVKEGA